MEGGGTNINGASLSSFKIEFYTEKYKIGKRILSEGSRCESRQVGLSREPDSLENLWKSVIYHNPFCAFTRILKLLRGN